ncbi:Na+/H+ antiporter subunit E [Nesterenkonia sp. NBAIMH1]|uniref:Na+/H+ antiporter subunit E n=1 Tax=Nesterenkonia sp. NBAIMH1 TaxID=2600320 RepID=UPI0011B79F2D|nr:Na+/H+ antiporter subunit E [Nesterenkonia sp. NBAIMH1]
MSPKNPSSAAWPLRILSFLLWYAKEFFLANLQVTADVLRRHQRMSPAIAAIPAASRSEAEWTMISVLITLTPGTMTMTVSRDEGLLYVHGMFAETRDALAEEIQDMENRMLRAMRRTPGDLSRPLAPEAGEAP